MINDLHITLPLGNEVHLIGPVLFLNDDKLRQRQLWLHLLYHELYYIWLLMEYLVIPNGVREYLLRHLHAKRWRNDVQKFL